MLNVGSLFAGIGGFDLGLERAGMRVIWQSEIDPYASAVLRKHWPDVPNHGDIRGITAATVERPDVLCGGFPCQDISNAGKRAGIDGERSGLWSEYARVIGELRPRFVIVENVSALLGRGLERVLGDLAALGFDAEWHCIPAASVGAPHRRDRVWIVAHAARAGWDAGCAIRSREGGSLPEPSRSGEDMAHADSSGGQAREQAAATLGYGYSLISNGSDVADTSGSRLAQRIVQPGICGDAERGDARQDAVMDGQHPAHYAAIGDGIRRGDAAGQWWTEPDVGRVAHGIPSRVDRLRCLGNAIVPQVAEIIGRAIVSAST